MTAKLLFLSRFSGLKKKQEKAKKMECTYREEFTIRRSLQLPDPGEQLKNTLLLTDLLQKPFCLFQSNVIRWRKVKKVHLEKGLKNPGQYCSVCTVQMLYVAVLFLPLDAIFPLS